MNDSIRQLWFASAGAKLFAVELGEGRPIVLLHGGLADHQASLFRLGGLAASHRLITPDLRGSGRSIYSGPLSWDLLADDVIALLDHLEIDRAAIAGVSAGAAVAVRTVLRHPIRASGMLLVSPAFGGRERGLVEAQTAAMRAMQEVGERTLTEGIDALRPLYARLPSPMRELALDMMSGFDPASVAATTRFLASGAQPFETGGDLDAIDAPTLLVPGTDPEHPAEVCSLYARHLRRNVVVDASSPNLIGQIARFVESID